MSHGITSNDQMYSVREVPWHGLGVVLDEYPKSIDEALEKAGLGWKVSHGDVLVVKRPEWIDDFGTKHAPELIPAKGFKANVREDTGDVGWVELAAWDLVLLAGRPGWRLGESDRARLHALARLADARWVDLAEREARMSHPSRAG